MWIEIIWILLCLIATIASAKGAELVAVRLTVGTFLFSGWRGLYGWLQEKVVNVSDGESDCQVTSDWVNTLKEQTGG